MERVKGVVQDAVANADIPFHQVVDAAAVARSPAYTPVFQTQLTLEGWAGEPDAAGGKAQGRMGDLAAEPLPVRHPHSSLDRKAPPDPKAQSCMVLWRARAAGWEAQSGAGAWEVGGSATHMPFPMAELVSAACACAVQMLPDRLARCMSSPKRP